MGLDMYLTKRHYVKNWSFTKEKDKYCISVLKNNQPVKEINTEKISYIIEDVMYWRKANAIHNWFVTNIQSGEDNCEEFWVDTASLEDLKELCEKTIVYLNGLEKNQGGAFIIDERIDDLLPVTEGFFFGSYQYDQWYYDSLMETIEALKNIDDNCDYYYRSSW